MLLVAALAQSTTRFAASCHTDTMQSPSALHLLVLDAALLPSPCCRQLCHIVSCVTPPHTPSPLSPRAPSLADSLCWQLQVCEAEGQPNSIEP